MNSNAVRFLNTHNLTLRALADKSGISKSTLSYTFSEPINQWKVGTLWSISHAVKNSPLKVAQDFGHHQWQLNISDSKQTIQGVSITDKSVYSRIKAVVMNEYFEGWQPSKHDIQVLIDSDTYPSSLVQHTMNNYFKAMRHYE